MIYFIEHLVLILNLHWAEWWKLIIVLFFSGITWCVSHIDLGVRTCNYFVLTNLEGALNKSIESDISLLPFLTFTVSDHVKTCKIISKDICYCDHFGHLATCWKSHSCSGYLHQNRPCSHLDRHGCTVLVRKTHSNSETASCRILKDRCG